VAALVAKAELEGEIGDTTVGAEAGLDESALRNSTPALISKAGAGGHFTEPDPRKKSASCSGNPKRPLVVRPSDSTPACVATSVESARSNARTAPSSATARTLKMVKNKVAPPSTEAELDSIMYELKGSPPLAPFWISRSKQGVVEKRGSWLSYNGSQLAQGRVLRREGSHQEQRRALR